jgi:vacuolar iron transporter family protein
MPRHAESHRVEAIGGLRAAVLGANDGIVSTASLIVGVAAGGATAQTVALTGVAGLVAGALSMAAGEYVSVSSQADSENADRAREAAELAKMPEAEREELTRIYVARGLDRALAEQVAAQLTEKDALSAHLRDELGLSEATSARPVQAAMFSAASFALGAALPLLVAVLVPPKAMILAVSVAGLLLLAALGSVGAHAGGAPVIRGVLRVTFWGALAFAATALIGRLFGASV